MEGRQAFVSLTMLYCGPSCDADDAVQIGKDDYKELAPERDTVSTVGITPHHVRGGRGEEGIHQTCFGFVCSHT
jgi:hypothetical protein